MRKVYRFLYILLLIGLFLAEFFHPITAINVDLGRHLLLGKIIASTHQVPSTNLLSYTYPDFPYTNTSWLTEVIYHYLFVFGGFNLLLVFNTLLIAFSFGLLVFYGAKKNPVSLATLLGSALYLLLLGIRSDIRPEVMSMLFLSLFMVILFSSREGNKMILWSLIPLEILWVNMHIYFFVGPLLIALFLFDSLLTQRKNIKIYSIVFIGTSITTIVNPNGIKGALFPLSVLQNYGLPVIENQSIPTLFATYHSSQVLLSLFAISLLFVVLFFARKQTRPIDWLLAAVFSLGAIFIFRNILLFVFATFIPFIAYLNFLSTKCKVFIQKLPAISYFLFYPVSLLILFVFIVSSISANGFGFGVDEKGKGAVDLLVSHKISGPIYNNFDIGDYLSYRIYPRKVFVDNRPEAYPASFFKDVYLPMQNKPKIFTKLDRNYHFNVLVIFYWDNTAWGYPLLRYLENNSPFKLIYRDSYTIILLRDTPANKSIIAKYLVTKKSVKLSKNPQEFVHELFFFEKVGWRDKVREMLQDMQKNDPALCLLLQYPIEKTSIKSYVQDHGLDTNCYL